MVKWHEQFSMKRRLLFGSESTAQLENKSCVCGVVVSRADQTLSVDGF